MNRPLRVVVLEDNEADARLMLHSLEASGLHLEALRADDRDTFLAALGTAPDVVLADLNLPAYDGLEALREASERVPDVPVLVVTGTLDDEDAVACMRAGATDYLLKDRLTRLPAAVRRAVEERERRRHQEVALRASEIRFRELFDNASDAIITIDLDGNVLEMNRAAEEVSGYSRRDAARMTIYEVLGEDATPTVRDMLSAKLRGDGPETSYEVQLVRKDGEALTLDVHSRLIRAAGQPIGVQAIARDITERRRAEQALRDSERRFRTLVHNSSDITSLLAPDGTTLFESESVERLLGYPPEALVGTNAFDLVHPDDRAAVRRRFQQVIDQGTVPEAPYRVRTSAGGWRWLASVGSNLLDDPDVHAIVVNSRDVTERVEAEQRARALNEDLQVQLRRMTALLAIGDLVTGDLDLRAALARFVDIVHANLAVDAVWVDLHHAESDTVELLEMRGWRHPPEPGSRLPVSSTLVGKAVRERRVLVLHSREEIAERFPDEERLAREGFEVFGAAPMMARGTLHGGLAFAHRSPRPVEAGWLGFVEALANHGAILVESATLLTDLRTRNEELRAAYDATIEGWSRALDLRDKETEGHSRRVTELTLRLARAMGLTEETLLHLRRGALLHDIGKMGVPDGILQKPGKLTEEEWRVMKRHTTYARDLLAPIAFLGPALDIPYAHHERWDGSGYPEGLRGESIPLAARIFAVADVYDALTSDRPYRPAWTPQRALQHIREGAGSHFDPHVVDAFLAMQTGSAP